MLGNCSHNCLTKSIRCSLRYSSIDHKYTFFFHRRSSPLIRSTVAFMYCQRRSCSSKSGNNLVNISVLRNTTHLIVLPG